MQTARADGNEGSQKMQDPRLSSLPVQTTSTEAWIYRNGETREAVIAFRGTSNPQDMMTDASLSLSTFSPGDRSGPPCATIRMVCLHAGMAMGMQLRPSHPSAAAHALVVLLLLSGSEAKARLPVPQSRLQCRLWRHASHGQDTG